MAAKVWLRVVEGVAVEHFSGESLAAFPPDWVWVDVTGLDPRPVEGWAWDGATWSAPVVPLGDRKAAMRRAAAAALAARIALGMPFNGKTLQIDDASQARMTAAAAMANAGSLPTDFAWRMADNSVVPMDAAGVLGMAVAAGARVYALRAHYWALADLIAGAADEAELAAIDVSAGWPE